MKALILAALILSGCATPGISGSYDIASAQACTWEQQNDYFGLINGLADPIEIDWIRHDFQRDFECNLDKEPEA